MAFTHIQVNKTLSYPPEGNGSYASYPPGPSNTNFSILAIAIVGIVATAFLLVSYYVFVIKCCLNMQHFSNRFRHFRSFRHLSEPQNQRQQRPVIYAPENKGLEEYVIQSIPVILFKRKDCFLSEDSCECPVCLNQFEEGEKLRILPKCTHAFHIDCIDTWLQANSNCPLCRSSVSNTVITHEFRIEIDSPFVESHRSFDSDGKNGFPRENGSTSQSMEMGVQTEERGQSTMDISGGSDVSPKKKAESGFLEVKFMSRKSPADGKKIHHKHHLSGVGDECIYVRERDDQFSIEPIRRSFSMDSCADRQLYISVAEILAQNPHLREVGMGEGPSKSKRTFFSFSHERGISRNAILPVRMESRIC